MNEFKNSHKVKNIYKNNSVNENIMYGLLIINLEGISPAYFFAEILFINLFILI